MKRYKKTKKSTLVRINADMHRQLKMAAAMQETTMTTLLNRACEAWLSNKQDNEESSTL